MYLNIRRPLIIDITAMMDDDQSQAEPKGADQPLTGGDPTYLDLDPKPYPTEYFVKTEDVFSYLLNMDNN